MVSADLIVATVTGQARGVHVDYICGDVSKEGAVVRNQQNGRRPSLESENGGIKGVVTPLVKTHTKMHHATPPQLGFPGKTPSSCTHATPSHFGSNASTTPSCATIILYPLTPPPIQFNTSST